jgi:hypothetical protein
MKNFADNVTINNLFDNRRSIGPKLLEIMKSKGHSKVSFSRITGINISTLNSLFSGEIASKATYITNINKIMKILNVTLEEIVNCSEKKITKSDAAFSDDAQNQHNISPEAKEMFDVLDGILHLCELYY